MDTEKRTTYPEVSHFMLSKKYILLLLEWYDYRFIAESLRLHEKTGG